MMLDLVDEDCLLTCMDYLPTQFLVGTCSLVSKQFNRLITTRERDSRIWQQRLLVCRREFNEQLFKFIQSSGSVNVRVEDMSWLKPLLELNQLEKLQVSSVDDFDVNSLGEGPFSHLRTVDVSSCRVQIPLLRHILSRTDQIQELKLAPSRSNDWSILHDLILNQKNLKKLSIGRVKVDERFLVQLFQQLPLTSFTSDSGQISSDSWRHALSLQHVQRTLKHLSITNLVREKPGQSSPSINNLSLRSLTYKSCSGLLGPLLEATSSSLRRLDITFIDSFQLASHIEFTSLKSLKLVNVSPTTALRILAGCNHNLTEIDITFKYDAAPLPEVELQIPNLKTISVTNIPQQILSMIMKSSNAVALHKFSVQFPAQEASRQSWEQQFTNWQSVTSFDGEISLFNHLPDRVLSTISNLRIRLPLSKQRDTTILDEDLLKRFSRCESVTKLDLSVDKIVYPNTLAQILDAMTCLSALHLKGKYPMHDGDSFPNPRGVYPQLTELCFDYSGLTSTDMEKLLAHLPQLSSLLDAQPQPIHKFYHLLNLLNERPVDSLASIVGPSDTEEVLDGVYLHQKAATTLLLDTRLSFEEMIVTCICTKYNTNYTEACNSIDLLNAGNVFERDSKLFYEARAISVYIDLLDHISNLTIEQKEDMKRSFDERGLPPCVKRLIDLHAPAIC